MIGLIRVSFLALFMILPDIFSRQEKQTAPDGKALYNKHCLTCHQADGSGVPGMFPPLLGTDKVLGRADSLIKILLTGLKGPLEIKGETYYQEMPAVDYLADQDIAAILTFVRSSWENKAPLIKPKDVTKVRSSLKKH